MKHIDFFEILVAQHYFSDNTVDLILVPEASTLLFLKKQHFVIRSTEKGLKILIPVAAEGGQLPVLKPKEILRFTVFATTSNFSKITEILEVKNDEVLFFSNAGLKKEEQELKVSKTKGDQVQSKHKVVAKIEIHLSKVHHNLHKNPIKYQVVFDSKSTKWKYYIISNTKTEKVEIKDRDAQLIFKELTHLEKHQDEIATSLGLTFPDKQLLVFESNTAVNYSSNVIKNIQLFKNEQLIINHLSNPSIGANGTQIIQI